VTQKSTYGSASNRPKEEKDIYWEDFLIYAQMRFDRWCQLHGLHIPHNQFGLGEVISLVERRGVEPLINVRFPNVKDIVKFNRLGFQGGTLFSAPIKLAELVNDAAKTYKDQRQREEELAQKLAKEEREYEELLAQRAQKEQEDARQRLALREEALRTERVRLENIKLSRAIAAEEALQRERMRLQKIKMDRALAAIAHLVENGVNHLWHFTSIENLKLIASSGYLYGPSKNPHIGLVKFLSDDVSREQDQRLLRNHFVRLSYIPNSWYFHRVRWSHNLVWLRFTLDFLKSEEVRFAKGNAASGSVHIRDDLPILELDWGLMKEFQGTYSDDVGPRQYPSRYPKDYEDQQLFREISDTWNSEVLVENSLPFAYCDRIYDARTGVRVNG